MEGLTITKGMTIEVSGAKLVVLEVFSKGGIAGAYCQTPQGKRVTVKSLYGIDVKVL